MGRKRREFTKEDLRKIYEREIAGYKRGIKMQEERIDYLNVKIHETQKKIDDL